MMLKRLTFSNLRNFLVCVALIYFSVCMVEYAHAEIKAKSVWSQTNINTISSQDVFGNKISFVCNRGLYSMYVSTTARAMERGTRTRVSLWAAHDLRLEYYASSRSSRVLMVNLNDNVDLHHLLFDLRDRYDLSVLINGVRDSIIVQFPLDGFAEEFNKTCI